jgi:hypothetical protein
MVLGALVAASALSAAIEFRWRSPISAGLGAKVAEVKIPLEEWPICTTMGTMMGSESDWAQLDPDLGPAMQHYQYALLLNRRHRSAHEHLGELYLVLGEPAKAEQQLATLEEICLIPCAETEDLTRAISVYNTLATR